MTSLLNYYNDGTVTVSNGSTGVTGVGTSWSVIRAGDEFWANGYSVRVASVESQTALTLAYPWPGTGLSTGTYEIRLPPPSADVTTTIRKLLDTLNTGSAFQFVDGDAGTPGISFASDPDTGFYHSAPNTVALSAGGAEVAFFDPDGISITALFIQASTDDYRALTLEQNFGLAGTGAVVLTSTGSTALTLPATGTLATLAGAETITNKTLNLANNTVSNITTAMFATNVVDIDSTLAANSDTRIASQKAMKSYMDNLATGLSWKPACQIGTTTNITLSGQQTINGVVGVVGTTRVAVMGQTDAKTNGIYVMQTGAWTRALDADTAAEIWGMALFVQNDDSAHGGTQWTNNNTALPVLGTSNLTFAQVAGAGTYTNGTGLTLTGNVFSLTQVNSLTSLALGGATIGTNALAVTGTTNLGGASQVSVAGASNAAALALTGAIYAAGTGTTNVPHLFIQPSGTTAATSWSTSGTLIGANIANTFAGSLVDLKVAGTTQLSVGSTGSLTSVGDLIAGSGGAIGWTSRAKILSPADSKLTLLNNAATDFSLLQFGGTTSSFPAIKRNAAALNFRLADDSAAAAITAGAITGTAGTLSGALVMGAATGGPQGNGTINAQAIYVNGIQVGAAATFIYNKYVDTATAAQTVFTHAYTPGYLEVFLDGSKLSPSEYTATDGTTITLGTAAELNQIVEIIAWSVLSLTTPIFNNPVTFADGGVWDAAGIHGVASASIGNLPGRNRVINGDVRINQRAIGTTVSTGTGGYAVDMWQYSAAQASKFTYGQDTGSLPAGFAYALKHTSNSSYTAISTDYFAINHFIEGLNVSDMDFGKSTAKTFTVSFWARGSAAGNYSFTCSNSANTRSYSTTYALTANTWTYVKKTIPGDTSGTWLRDTNVGICLKFDLGSGSNYKAASNDSWLGVNNVAAAGTVVSVVGTSGATFAITGLQLEAGSVATPFEFRDYQSELFRCFRYFYRWTSTGGYDIVCTAAVGSGQCSGYFPFPVPLRKNAAFGTTDGFGFGQNLEDGTGNQSGTLTGTTSGYGFLENTKGMMLHISESGLSGGTRGYIMAYNAIGAAFWFDAAF